MRVKGLDKRRSLGGQGEDLAAAFLTSQGYQILARNYRTPWGELDLIARHQGFLVFVEVKTRRTERFGPPQEAVHPAKQEKLRTLAAYYLQQKSLAEVLVRFDVVAVRLTAQGPEIELIQQAF
jgi:putative endonuclease